LCTCLFVFPFFFFREAKSTSGGPTKLTRT
jgi:hypothetical protein